jgi:hypothetical protein
MRFWGSKRWKNGRPRVKNECFWRGFGIFLNFLCWISGFCIEIDAFVYHFTTCNTHFSYQNASKTSFFTSKPLKIPIFLSKTPIFPIKNTSNHPFSYQKYPFSPQKHPFPHQKHPFSHQNPHFSPQNTHFPIKNTSKTHFSYQKTALFGLLTAILEIELTWASAINQTQSNVIKTLTLVLTVVLLGQIVEFGDEKRLFGTFLHIKRGFLHMKMVFWEVFTYKNGVCTMKMVFLHIKMVFLHIKMVFWSFFTYDNGVFLLHPLKMVFYIWKHSPSTYKQLTHFYI